MSVAQLQKRLFSVDEYYKMVESGILNEQDRIELIEGEIIYMSPIGRLHIGCVFFLNQFFSQNLGNNETIISVQSPLILGDFSEPEPDIILLKPQDDYYRKEKPTSKDVLLIIEVADTSLYYDKNTKIPLYARHSIPEVWLVDLESNQVIIHRVPTENGYQQEEAFSRGQTLTPLQFPAIKISVDDIVGKSQ